MSPQLWLNLKSHYDLEIELDRLEGSIEYEVKVYSGAG